MGEKNINIKIFKKIQQFLMGNYKVIPRYQYETNYYCRKKLANLKMPQASGLILNIISIKVYYRK